MLCRNLLSRFAYVVLAVLFLSAGLVAGTLFKTPQNYATGGLDTHVMAIADVNGDGKLDVLTARQCGPQSCSSGGDAPAVDLLLGNGDGTFASPVPVAPPAVSIVVADMNHDGKPDLISGTDLNITVSLGRGDGTFETATTLYPAGGSYVVGLAVADVNGDGKLDVLASYGCPLVACINKHRAGVLIGNGDGTLKPVKTYALLGTGESIDSGAIRAIDVNGDGFPDLVVLEPRSQLLTVLLGRGDGTFRAPHGFAVPFDTGAFQFADLNGDGKVDVAVATNCGDPSCTAGAMGVLFGNGNGTFQPVQLYLSGAVGATSIAIGDVNADGKLDIVVSNSCKFVPGGCAPGSVGVFSGNGDGTFNAVELYSSAGMFANEIRVVDINRDKKPDVLVLNRYQNFFTRTQGSVAVLLGKAQFKTTTTLQSSLNPSDLGQAVTFTASVTSASSTPVSGTVTFFNGTTSLGRIALNAGVAKLTTTRLPVGVSPITATYNGSSLFLKSTSAVLNQTVNGTAASAANR